METTIIEIIEQLREEKTFTEKTLTEWYTALHKEIPRVIQESGATRSDLT